MNIFSKEFLMVLQEEKVKDVVAQASSVWVLTQRNNLYAAGLICSNYYLTTFTKMASNVKSFSCSDSACWYIDYNDNLYGIGKNDYGQQGNGTTTDVTTFTLRATGVKSVYSFGWATWYITNDNKLYGCGRNHFGQQGNGTTTDVTTFTQRGTAQAVFSDGNITWKIDTSGKLYGCGQNNNGQQGSGNTTDVLTFTQRATNVKSVYINSGGANATWYINNNNELYGCGANSSGQQGSGGTSTVKTFTKRADNVKSFFPTVYNTFYINTSNVLYACGLSYTKRFAEVNTNVKDCFSRSSYTRYLTNDGKLYFGSTVKATDVKEAVRGFNVDWYINNNDELYGCGANGQGQQGDGTTTDVNDFTKRAENVRKISIESGVSYATYYITNDDELYCCGSNTYGQQGNGERGSGKKVLTFTKRKIG